MSAGELRTINWLADETHLDRRTIKKAIGNGPCTLREFIDRWVAYNTPKKPVQGDLEAEKTRLTAAQADTAELKLAEARLQLLPVETIFRVWENVIVSIRRTIETSPLPNEAKDSIFAELASIKDIDVYKEQKQFDEGEAAEGEE